MPAALQSKKKASSNDWATLFAPSFSAWGAGTAMGRGRKLAPEISMIGAWASAPNGQVRRQRTRVRITGMGVLEKVRDGTAAPRPASAAGRGGGGEVAGRVQGASPGSSQRSQRG